MMNDGNVAEVLTPGHHIIEVNENMSMINNICGLYPMARPVRKIFTHGLHWVLDGNELSMHDMVSTSM